MSPDEVGAFELPFVSELLEYWVEYPPSHLLLRMLARYEPKHTGTNWRKQRADEMGDDRYVPKAPKQPDRVNAQIVNEMIGGKGTRHVDCAPGHIQEAIARVKRGDHMKVPQQ